MIDEYLKHKFKSVVNDESLHQTIDDLVFRYSNKYNKYSHGGVYKLWFSFKFPIYDSNALFFNDFSFGTDITQIKRSLEYYKLSGFYLVDVKGIVDGLTSEKMFNIDNSIKNSFIPLRMAMTPTKETYYEIHSVDPEINILFDIDTDIKKFTITEDQVKYLLLVNNEDNKRFALWKYINLNDF